MAVAQKSYVMLMGEQIVGYAQADPAKLPPMSPGVQLVEVPQLVVGIDPNRSNIEDPVALKAHFAMPIPT
jgi:hypothetical protein